MSNGADSGLPRHTKFGPQRNARRRAKLTVGANARLLWLVDTITQPIGQIFLRFLFMVVIPLVFTSVTLGVASLGDIRRIGRIG